MHQVVLAWLRAERDGHLKNAIGSQALAAHAYLLDSPDLNDADQNWLRLRLLLLARNLFVVEIPPDTVWYGVADLEHSDLGELHSVDHPSWTDPADNNELLKVCARKKLPLKLPPEQWDTPILWGHGKNGPFTILEGNHRLAAYAASNSVDLKIPVFVGLSSMPCIWHVLDTPKRILLRDQLR